jgi:hypothetical protein
MSRSWKDVKADKARRDTAAGRDMTVARANARTRTQAYILGFRLAQLREQVGMALGGRLRLVADFDDHDIIISASEIDGTPTHTYRACWINLWG